MTFLSDKSIRALCKRGVENPMIRPFVGKTVRVNSAGLPILSYGLGSEGYDVRCKTSGIIANKNYSGVLSVKNPDLKAFIKIRADKNGDFIVPAGGLLLVHTLEYFIFPNNAIMFVGTKSKFARVGVSLNFTNANPGWRGNLLLEIQNSMPFPVSFNCHEGVAKMIFGLMDTDSTPYSGQFQQNKNPAVSKAH